MSRAIPARTDVTDVLRRAGGRNGTPITSAGFTGGLLIGCSPIDEVVASASPVFDLRSSGEHMRRPGPTESARGGVQRPSVG